MNLMVSSGRWMGRTETHVFFKLAQGHFNTAAHTFNNFALRTNTIGLHIKCEIWWQAHPTRHREYCTRLVELCYRAMYGTWIRGKYYPTDSRHAFGKHCFVLSPRLWLQSVMFRPDVHSLWPVAQLWFQFSAILVNTSLSSQITKLLYKHLKYLDFWLGSYFFRQKYFNARNLMQVIYRSETWLCLCSRTVNPGV